MFDYFKHLCSICSTELIKNASKCQHCGVFYCDECFDKFTHKKVFSCQFCKQTKNIYKSDVFTIQIKDNLIIRS